MNKAILIAVIFLAAILRLWQLGSNPPSLNWDEVSHGYNAYAILTTGRDEWGQKFPLTSFRAYGDYKLPLYIYTTVPFVAVLGLSEQAVRLPSALAGVGSVVFIFLLVNRLFKSSYLALTAALLLAISPWHIALSRAAFEANLALYLGILALYLFVKGLDNEKFLLPVSFLILGLSTYTYNSAKIFAPLLILALLILYRKKLINQIKLTVLSISVFFLLFFPHLLIFPTPEGQARFYWSTILDQGAINRIGELRINSSLPPILSRVLYNKPIFFLTHFVSNWLYHFNPYFLFIKGGTHYQYSIPGRGVMYFTSLPFLIAGVIWLWRLRNKSAKLILIWLVLAPIPSAMTRESPHLLRAIFLLPPLQVITAGGLIYAGGLLPKVYRRFYLGGIALIFGWSLISFMIAYFGNYRLNYSFAWQYGYKEMTAFIGKNYHNYQQIIITKKYGEPHEFLLFYLKWPPEKYYRDPQLVRFYQSNWYWVDRFDKFYFVNDWQIPKDLNWHWLTESGLVIPKAKTLLVTSPGNYPDGWRKLQTINFLNGEAAFEIYEFSE